MSNNKSSLQAEIGLIEKFLRDYKINASVNKGASFVAGRSFAGPALVYLLRRFGFPDAGSDPHKHVCAYTLPVAKMPATNLLLTIHGTRARIGWQAQRDVYCRYVNEMQMLRGDGAWDILPGTVFMEQCHDATVVALTDLCRPVFVRDEAITIFGAVGGYGKPVAERYAGAGYGLDREWLAQPGVFLDFLDFVRQRGGGDRAAGIHAIMTEHKPAIDPGSVARMTELSLEELPGLV